MNDNTIAQKFKKLNCCVIIPTYNNHRTIKDVLNRILKYTHQVIVINDGATDETPEILSEFKDIHKVSYVKNRGKGYALQKGFEAACQKGYQYAITIDSDGQHFPEDLPQFIEKLEQEPNSIIIGARNMNQESIPGGSSFGHKFSNFWFWTETGIKAPDTQSGYRLYPLEKLKNMHFFTNKYEFEIEVIVRLAWKGIPVHAVPITVYYAPKSERISHFRPYIDFARVSILNSVLVFFSFIYFRPLNFIKNLFKPKKN